MKRTLPFAIYLAIFSFLVMGPPGAWLADLPEGLIYPARLLLFALLVLGAAWLLRRLWPGPGWGQAILLAALAQGVVYKLASFLPELSTYPFSLGWSEASRYYYASLYLSDWLYGLHVPPSILHPSRYLLQAIPFLLPDSPLWLHRLWQVLLWLVTSGLAGWLLARRLFPPSTTKVVTTILPPVVTTDAACPPSVVTAWAALFLFQGPVYYHLLLMVILMLWAYDRRKPWRTLGIVLLASLWAGISRINWLPLSGLLAAALYLIELPLHRPLWRYLLPPAAWTLLGSAAALASQEAYRLWSGNPPEQFGSSFSSDLLWYRLLPNPTYPLGILPSAILVSLPLVALMGLHLLQNGRRYHPLRLLGLAAILFMFFAGGVVVSVKIGGGSNLHNLDAYLVLLLVVGSLITLGQFTPDSPSSPTPLPGGEGSKHPTHYPSGRILSASTIHSLLSTALLLPIAFAVASGSPLPQRDFAAAQADLQTLRQAVEQTVQQGGEALFINQRHLLTFGYVDAPLAPDYELVFLMEMAMASNAPYLDAFHADLRSQRFALIVAEPLNVQYQGRAHSFGEENDAWVRQVSEPLLCDYQLLLELETAGVALYVPRPQPCR
jgi:hypothetical protein